MFDALAGAGFDDVTPAQARVFQRIALGPLAAAVVAEVEAEWTGQLGRQRMRQLRDALTRLREVTDL